MKPALVDHDEDGEGIMSQTDQDEIERMQSVENLLSLANGDVEGDCIDDETSLEDETSGTVDTLALSVSNDCQQEAHQQLLVTEVDGMKAMRRMRHNNKEKERKDRIKIDYQEIRSLLPETYFSEKKQTTHHDMLQFCLKFMRTLMYQNKLLGGSSYNGLQSDLTVDAEEILRLRKENGELRDEIARYRRIIDSTGIPTNVEPDQLVVTWQLANDSSKFADIGDSGSNHVSSGMQQPTASFFDSMMSNPSTSQYCDTTMSHPVTSLCNDNDASSLYTDNQANAGNCGSDYSLFTDLLNGSTDGSGIPRMAQPQPNGVIQCVVQPNVMYHNGPNGTPFHTAPNSVQFIGQNGLQTNLVTTSHMPFVQQSLHQSGLVTTTHMPFMQPNGQIVFLPHVPTTAAPASSSVAAVEMSNDTGLGDTAMTSVDTPAVKQVDDSIENCTGEIIRGEVSATDEELTSRISEPTSEPPTVDFSEIAQDDPKASDDISIAVNNLTAELLTGETYNNEPCNDHIPVSELTNVDQIVISCDDESRHDTSCLSTPNVDSNNVETEQNCISNAETDTSCSVDAAEPNPSLMPYHKEINTGHNTDVSNSQVDVSNPGVSVQQITNVLNECNEDGKNDSSQQLTSVLESPVSMSSDKSTGDTHVYSASQQNQPEHLLAELQSVHSMPMPPQSFSFDSQQQFVAQTHQFGAHNAQSFGMQQTQPFVNQAAQSFTMPPQQQQFSAQQQTQFMQQAQSYITQPQQFMSHTQQFGTQQFTTQQPQQFAMTQQAGDPSAQSMQGTLVLHNGQLLLVNSQQPTVPQATHLGNGAATLGSANQAFGMQNPGAANTIFVNQFGGATAVPPPAPAMSQLAANQTVMVNTPTGPMALNTMPSQPNQHPSALILPNGQIVPVVTQPNLLFPPQQCTPVTGGLLVPSVPNQPVVNYMSSGVNANRMSMLTTNSLSGPIVSLASGSTSGSIVRGVVQYPVGARPTILGPSPLMQTVSAQMQVPLRIPTAAVVTAGCTTTMTIATAAASTATGGMRQQLPNLPQTVMATMTAEGTIILTMSSNEQTPTKQAAKAKKASAVQRPLMPKPSTTPKPFKASDSSSVTTPSPAVNFLTPARVPVAAPQSQTPQQCAMLPNGFIVNGCPVSVPSMAVSGLTPAAFITAPVHASGMTALSVSVGNEQSAAVSASSVSIAMTSTCTTDILAKATESIFMLSPSNGDHLSPTGLYIGANDSQLHIDLSSEPVHDQVLQVSDQPVIKPPCKTRSRSKKKTKTVVAFVPGASSSSEPVSMAASHIFDQLENGECDDDQTDISDFSDLLRLEPMTPAPAAHLSVLDGKEILSTKGSSFDEVAVAEISSQKTIGSLCDPSKLQSSKATEQEVCSLEFEQCARQSCLESQQLNDGNFSVNITVSPVKEMDCNTDIVSLEANASLLTSKECISRESGGNLVSVPNISDSCAQQSPDILVKSQKKNESILPQIAELPPVTVDVYSTSSKSLFERFNELLASPPLSSPSTVAPAADVSNVKSLPSPSTVSPAVVVSNVKTLLSVDEKCQSSNTDVALSNVEDLVHDTTSVASSAKLAKVSHKSARKLSKKLISKSLVTNEKKVIDVKVTTAPVNLLEKSSLPSCTAPSVEILSQAPDVQLLAQSASVDKPEVVTVSQSSDKLSERYEKSVSSSSSVKLRKEALDKGSDSVLSGCSVDEMPNDSGCLKSTAINVEKLTDTGNIASIKASKRRKKCLEKEIGILPIDTDHSITHGEGLESTARDSLKLPTLDGSFMKTLDIKQKSVALSNFVPETENSLLTRSCISAKAIEKANMDQPAPLDTPLKSKNKRKATEEEDTSNELPPVLTAVDPVNVGWNEELLEQRDMMEEATQTTRKELKSVAGEKRAKKQLSKSSAADMVVTTNPNVTNEIPETVTFDAHELLNMVDVVENMAVETQTERIRKSHSRKHRSSTSINADGELEMPSKRKKKNRDSSRFIDNVSSEIDQLSDKQVFSSISNASKSEKHRSADENCTQRVAMAPKNDPLDVFEFNMDDTARQDSSDIYSHYRITGKKRVGADTSDVSSRSVTALPSLVDKCTVSAKTQSGKLLKPSELLYDSSKSDDGIVKNLSDKENQSVSETITIRQEEGIVEKLEESCQNITTVKDDKAIVTSLYKHPQEASESISTVEELEGKTFVAARHSNIATLARHVAPPKMHGSTPRSATKQSAQLVRTRIECDISGANDLSDGSKSCSPSSQSQRSDIRNISGIESRSNSRDRSHTRSSRELATTSPAILQDDSSICSNLVVSDSGKNKSTVTSAESGLEKQSKDSSKCSQSLGGFDNTTRSVKKDELTREPSHGVSTKCKFLKDSSSLEKENAPMAVEITKPPMVDSSCVNSRIEVASDYIQPVSNSKCNKNKEKTPIEITELMEHSSFVIQDNNHQAKDIASSRDHGNANSNDINQVSNCFVQVTRDSSRPAYATTEPLQDITQPFEESVAKDGALGTSDCGSKQSFTKDSRILPASSQSAEHNTVTRVTKDCIQQSTMADNGRATEEKVFVKETLPISVDFDVNSGSLSTAKKLQSDIGFSLSVTTKSHNSDPWAENSPRNTQSKTSLPPPAIETNVNRSKYAHQTHQLGEIFNQHTPPLSGILPSGNHSNRYQDETNTVQSGNCSGSNVSKSGSREIAVNNISPAGSCSKNSVSGDKNRTMGDSNCLVNTNTTVDRSAASSRSDYARKSTAESNCHQIDHGRSYENSSRERTFGDSCVVENSSRGHSSGVASYGNDVRSSSSSGHVPSVANNNNASLRSNCAQKAPTSAVPADGRISRSSGGSQVSSMYSSGGMDCSGATKQRSSCQEEARHHQQQIESSDYFTHRPTSSSSCAVQNLSSASSSIVDPFHYPYPMLNGSTGSGTVTSQHHHDMALASYASSIAADYSLGRNPFYNFPAPFGFDPQPPASLRCPSGRFSPLSHNLPSCGIEKQSSNKSTSSATGPVGMSSTGGSVRAGQDATGSTADMNKSRHQSQHQQQNLQRDSFSSTQYGHCGAPSSNSQFLEPMSKDSNGGVGSRAAGPRLPNSSASTLAPTSRRTRSPAVSGQTGLDQSGSYGTFQGLVNTLTSPPLHHPPSTLPDRHCAASSHTSGPAGFDLSSYHSPAAVNQFSPNLTNVGFDPPPLNYSSVRDCANVAQSKKSDKDAKHSSVQTTTLQHKPPAQPPPPKITSRSSSSNKASKKSSSKPSLASSVSAPMYDIDTAGMFDSRCMTPYFGLTGGVSPNRGALQAVGASASDSLSYFPSNFFGNPGRPLTNSAKTLQHRHDSNPFNPFSPAGRAAANGLGGLNFQSGPTGFGMDAAHMANPMMSHTPSAHGFGAFGSLFDVGGVPMPDQRETLTGLSPIKFGHHGTNTASGISQDSLHHQQSTGSFAYGGRAAAAQHMLHDFNALLGGHHQHHASFDARTAAAAISGAMGPPFTGHHAAASFGMGALNFPMHNL